MVVEPEKEHSTKDEATEDELTFTQVLNQLDSQLDLVNTLLNNLS